ncbi:retrovirus-related pol polyprotein from transposon TNT 1-94 [Tanacetum coccineum]
MSYNLSGPFTSQSNEIVERTPYEILRNRKPSLEYFRFFGCKVFILNTKVHLTKFDLKSYEGVFLGYSQTSKAYIVLNKETLRIEKSLNVIFDDSLPELKSSPLVEDDKIIEPVVQNPVMSPLLEANVLESSCPKSPKEARSHPIEQVIGELNERTLRLERKELYTSIQNTHVVKENCFIEFGKIKPQGKRIPNQNTQATTTNTTSVTNAKLQAMTVQGVAATLGNTVMLTRSTYSEDSHNSRTECQKDKRVARKKTVGHDVAYAMTWTDLKKKMTNKYCPRSEIRNSRADLWKLWKMFFEESDKIEKYVGGLLDMIHGNKGNLTTQQISTASHQRQNVAQAYAAGTSERRSKLELFHSKHVQAAHKGHGLESVVNCRRLATCPGDCRNHAAARNQRTLETVLLSVGIPGTAD